MSLTRSRLTRSRLTQPPSLPDGPVDAGACAARAPARDSLAASHRPRPPDWLDVLATTRAHRPQALTELMRLSEGDMRRAIQMLQSLHQLHGSSIDTQAVRDVSGTLPDSLVSRIFTVCRSSSFDQMQALVADVLADGYPAAQLAAQMLDALITDSSATSLQKSKVRARARRAAPPATPAPPPPPPRRPLQARQRRLARACGRLDAAATSPPPTATSPAPVSMALRSP